MSFTCLKCAKCMAEVVGGIDWAIELNKPSEPIYRGKCDGHCLFDDDKMHTKILEENYRRLKSARAIKILLVDDKERAVLSLRKKIEEKKS